MRFICLLRGVNVGGGGTRLPMADFRAILEGLGCRDVATYIQSGNAVFRSDRAAAELAPAITAAITLPNGTHPAAFVLPLARMTAALVANPYPAADALPKTLHLIFTDRAVSGDADAIAALLAADEGWKQRDGVAYLHTPSGFGTSKLAGKLDRILRPAQITARNLATVKALIALAEAMPS